MLGRLKKASVGSPSIREFCFRKSLSRRANTKLDPAAEDLQNAFPYESKLMNTHDTREIAARVKLPRVTIGPLGKQAEFDVSWPAIRRDEKCLVLSERIPDPRLLQNPAGLRSTLDRPARDHRSCVSSPSGRSRNRPYDDTPEAHPCTFIPAHQTRHSGVAFPWRKDRDGDARRSGTRACACERALCTRERTRGIRYMYSALSQPGIVTGRISVRFNSAILRICMAYGDSKHMFRADCLARSLSRPNT